MKMPGACARGLVVNIRRHHRRCCCRRRRLTRCVCLGRLLWRILSSTYVVVAAVIKSSCACAWWLMDSSCACAWGFRRQHSLPSLPKKRARALAHDGILLAQSCVVDVDNNTQCERKLVRLHMRGLTQTYDAVAAAAAVLSPSPSRVGRYTITKLVHSCTIELWIAYESSYACAWCLRQIWHECDVAPLRYCNCLYLVNAQGAQKRDWSSLFWDDSGEADNDIWADGNNVAWLYIWGAYVCPHPRSNRSSWWIAIQSQSFEHFGATNNLNGITLCLCTIPRRQMLT
jgi:hypothetical protein